MRSTNTIGNVQHGTQFYEDNEKVLIKKDHHGDYHLSQMKHLTFWVSFDHRYGTKVIVGYKVLYEGFTHDSEE
jgi:hypothetical protein